MQPWNVLPATGSSQSDEWVRLGCEAQLVGNFPKAEQFYQAALRLNSANHVALHNMAVVYAQTGNINEGMLAMERAKIFGPTEPVIFANSALMFFEGGWIDQALADAKRGLELSPPKPVDVGADPLKTAGYVHSRYAAAMLAATAGHPELGLPLYEDILEVDPTHGAASPNSCFSLTLMDVGPKELFEQRQKWHSVNKWKGKFWPHRNDKKNPDRPLRVGYVSGDFKSHSAAMIFSAVILNHDRTKVEPYLYSSMPTEPDKDELTKMFRGAGTWREIVGKSDDEVDQMIQDDKIDILVDLSAHTNGGRLAVFTRKPAPVQVSAWGFAHGTGCPEIDYFFADPVAVPPEDRQYFAEKIWDLPCIVTYRQPIEYGIPGTSVLPYFRNQFITFGSFSRFEKMSDECLTCFAEILRGVPDSRLFLKDHAFKRPYSIRRVLSFMDGIDRERIMFGTSTSHQEHILAYQTCDLCLDPWPHGMGVVTMETMFAGVPLVTKYGKQASGRTAASVLTAMGHTDWIAKTKEQYVAKAIELAQDVPTLAKVRKALRQEFLDSPVVNGYREAVEEAYRQMWREWCK